MLIVLMNTVHPELVIRGGSDLVLTRATRLASRVERPFGLTRLAPPIPLVGFGMAFACSDADTDSNVEMVPWNRAIPSHDKNVP